MESDSWLQVESALTEVVKRVQHAVDDANDANVVEVDWKLILEVLQIAKVLLERPVEGQARYLLSRIDELLSSRRLVPDPTTYLLKGQGREVLLNNELLHDVRVANDELGKVLQQSAAEKDNAPPNRDAT